VNNHTSLEASKPLVRWPLFRFRRTRLDAKWPLLEANFYEKELFVEADVAALDRGRALQLGPFALCFYPHFRRAYPSVARCIG